MLHNKVGPLFGFEYAYSHSTKLQTSYHDHDNYEIYFLITGNSECFVRDKTYSISSNHILLIPKGTLHKNHYISHHYERAVINFTEEHVSANLLFKMKSLFEHCIYKPENPELVLKLFHKIGEEMDRNDDLSPELIPCYLTQLLSYFIRNKSESMYTPANNTNPSIDRLIRYINEHSALPITLESASEMLHLSQSHLSRLFTKCTGFGFKEYLQIIRIKNAKNMLKTTNHSIKQIAYDCGFTDSNYFSKAFKEATGLSPLQYRKTSYLYL